MLSVPTFVLAAFVLALWLTACDDIFGIDNYDPPNARLTGVEYVGVYVGTTTFVDRSNMAVRTEVGASEIASLESPISLAVELPESIWVKPEPGTRENVFVRIGIKTVVVSEMLCSPVEKVGI